RRARVGGRAPVQRWRRGEIGRGWQPEIGSVRGGGGGIAGSGRIDRRGVAGGGQHGAAGGGAKGDRAARGNFPGRSGGQPRAPGDRVTSAAVAPLHQRDEGAQVAAARGQLRAQRRRGLVIGGEREDDGVVQSLALEGARLLRLPG